jgi:hypothetical protein
MTPYQRARPSSPPGRNRALCTSREHSGRVTGSIENCRVASPGSGAGSSQGTWNPGSRRRPPSATTASSAVAGPRFARVLHPRLLGAARALVPRRARLRRPAPGPYPLRHHCRDSLPVSTKVGPRSDHQEACHPRMKGTASESLDTPVTTGGRVSHDKSDVMWRYWRPQARRRASRAGSLIGPKSNRHPSRQAVSVGRRYACGAGPRSPRPWSISGRETRRPLCSTCAGGFWCRCASVGRPRPLSRRYTRRVRTASGIPERAESAVRMGRTSHCCLGLQHALPRRPCGPQRNDREASGHWPSASVERRHREGGRSTDASVHGRGHPQNEPPF